MTDRRWTLRTLLAGLAVTLAVTGLGGCRTAPTVAAYVGSDEIGVDDLDAAVAQRTAEPAVAAFRLHARRHGLTEVSLQGTAVRFSPVELPESKTLRLRRLYPGAVYKPASRTISAPRPATGGVGVRDSALLDWCRDLLDGVLGELASESVRR